MNRTTFEEYLQQFGTLIYKNVGTSMLPMLKQGRDLFSVRKKGEKRCKKYDVILYRRPPGQYVLHRIVEVRENDYVVLGDNCVRKEYGITDEDILGVMTSFVHNGKTYQADDLRYKVYVFCWCKSYRLRMAAKRLKGSCMYGKKRK